MSRASEALVLLTFMLLLYFCVFATLRNAHKQSAVDSDVYTFFYFFF